MARLIGKTVNQQFEKFVKGNVPNKKLLAALLLDCNVKSLAINNQKLCSRQCSKQKELPATALLDCNSIQDCAKRVEGQGNVGTWPSFF